MGKVARCKLEHNPKVCKKRAKAKKGKNWRQLATMLHKNKHTTAINMERDMCAPHASAACKDNEWLRV